MKKNILFMVFGMILMLIVGVGVYAINATDINYKNNKTVSDALDDLYNNVGGRIGETYSSTNYGHQRLTNMSTSIENLPSGKYICNATFSASTAVAETNYIDTGNTNSFVASGCDSTKMIKKDFNNIGASGQQISGSGAYHLISKLSYIFECDINNAKTISISTTNTAVNWIPWVMSLDCTSVE